MLVIGPNDTGKKTLINALSNYILGVEYDDAIRYRLVDIERKSGDTGSVNRRSEKVSIHHIPSAHIVNGVHNGSHCINIISTSGLHNVQSVEDLSSIMEREFTNLQVDHTLLVAKATDIRLNTISEAIFKRL